MKIKYSKLFFDLRCCLTVTLPLVGFFIGAFSGLIVGHGIETLFCSRDRWGSGGCNWEWEPLIEPNSQSIAFFAAYAWCFLPLLVTPWDVKKTSRWLLAIGAIASLILLIAERRPYEPYGQTPDRLASFVILWILSVLGGSLGVFSCSILRRGRSVNND